MLAYRHHSRTGPSKPPTASDWSAVGETAVWSAGGRVSLVGPASMLGRLCGRVERCFFDRRLEGAVVTATYRFEFDPTGAGGERRVQGVIEGAVLQGCATGPECLELGQLSNGANPRVEQGHRIEVFDHAGSPMPNTEIRTWGTITGLHLWYRTEIQLAAPARRVRLTLGRFAEEGTVTAIDSAGNTVDQELVSGPQNTAITVQLAGNDIARVVIECPQDEHLLQQFCVEL